MSETAFPGRAVVRGADDPTLEFAAEELQRFLTAHGALVFETPDESSGDDPSILTFVLERATDLAEGAFRVVGPTNDKPPEVRLQGAGSAEVLHAVYTMLEKVGWRFEITGPVPPAEVHLERLRDWSETIQPFTRRRGIRQHLNFPMDVSSYPLDEALEYLRNLARLRHNAITFHSYPGQWVRGPQWGDSELAGAFFYGVRHDVPDHPAVRPALRNDKTFCIPEIEPVFDDAERRSEQAVQWLRALIREAKRLGMRVQFSFEPRSETLDVDLTATTARNILSDYPEIDALEFVTMETGGWDPVASAEEVAREIETFFGPEGLEVPAVRRTLDLGYRLTPALFRQIGHNARAIAAMRESLKPGESVGFVLGVYCVIPEPLAACFALMRKVLPPDVEMAIMPGHGSERVARNLREAELTAEDLARTTVYSWLEFDGNMYLQQNGIPGLRDLARDLADRPPLGLLANHWRTAENRLTARYAALSAVGGELEEERYYLDTAAGLGIEPALTFADAMADLAEADRYATDTLPNIGFCYVGCWGRTGLGYFGGWMPRRMRAARLIFEGVRQALAPCARATAPAAGRELLAFLDNRIRCTIVYLKSMEKGLELQRICGGRKPEDLADEERPRVVAVCDHAIALMEQYLQLHAQALPDRGSEGTLISAFYTPPAVLKRIRHEYGGVAMDAELAVQDPLDEPPSPMRFED